MDEKKRMELTAMQGMMVRVQPILSLISFFRPRKTMRFVAAILGPESFSIVQPMSCNCNCRNQLLTIIRMTSEWHAKRSCLSTIRAVNPTETANVVLDKAGAAAATMTVMVLALAVMAIILGVTTALAMPVNGFSVRDPIPAVRPRSLQHSGIWALRRCGRVSHP